MIVGETAVSTYTRPLTRARARAHARTHTHTHTCLSALSRNAVLHLHIDTPCNPEKRCGINKHRIHMCASPSIIWVTKLRRMRWARHVAHMVETRGVYGVLVGET